MDAAKTHPRITMWLGVLFGSQILPPFVEGFLVVWFRQQLVLPRFPLPVVFMFLLCAELFLLFWWATDHARKVKAAGQKVVWWRLPQVKVTQWRRRVEVSKQFPKWCRQNGFYAEVFKQKITPNLGRMTFDHNSDLKTFIHPGRLTLSMEPLEKAATTLRGSVRDCVDVEVRRRRDGHPGSGTVEFAWSNPLAKTTTLGDLPLTTDKAMASYGVRKDGRPAMWRKDRSVLIGGMTGQGKSNLIWIMLASLLADGEWVNLYVADNKGGVELPALERFAGVLQAGTKANPNPTLQVTGEQMGRLKVEAYVTDAEGDDTKDLLLPKAVHDMKVRRLWQRKNGHRKLTKSTRENPLCVVIIDELLLISTVLREGTKGDLGKLLSGGRASLFTVWMATQSAHVESIPGSLRTLIPYRVCFKTDTPEATDTVLGKGAEGRGAKCSQLHQINDRGVAYSGSETEAGFSKVRTPYVSDSDIDLLVQGKVTPAMLERGVSGKSSVVPYVKYEVVNRQPAWVAKYGRRSPYVGIVGLSTSKAGKVRTPQDRYDEHRRDDWGWCDLCQQEENWWLAHCDPALDQVSIVERHFPEGETAALAAEKKHIRVGRPVFNIQHNGTRRSAVERVQGWVALMPRKQLVSVGAEPEGFDPVEPSADFDPVVDGDEPHMDGVWSE